jgi:hypothetical protein
MIAGGLGRCIGSGVAGAVLTLLASGAAIASCPGDTNGDALVNINDVLNVLGDWGTGPFAVPGSDTNGDGVVDVTDFLTVVGGWGPCPSGPFLDDYANSGCLPGAVPGEGPCEEDDRFSLAVTGDRLHIAHFDATYNCCPDDIAVTLEVDGCLLMLTEEEILVLPCFCVCCYEVDSVVEGLAPGEYTVEYRWYDYETGQEQCHVEVVVVEEPA